MGRSRTEREDRLKELRHEIAVKEQNFWATVKFSRFIPGANEEMKNMITESINQQARTISELMSERDKLSWKLGER